MNNAELNAAKLLLDVGVSIPVRTPGFLRRKGKPRHIVMRTPTYGLLALIAKKYLETGVTYAEAEAFTFEQNMEFWARHSKAISQMVAYGVRGGRFFNKIVAWYLRWRVHPVFMQEAWFQFLSLLDTTGFLNIIKSAEQVNLMKPRMSQD